MIKKAVCFSINKCTYIIEYIKCRSNFVKHDNGVTRDPTNQVAVRSEYLLKLQMGHMATAFDYSYSLFKNKKNKNRLCSLFFIILISSVLFFGFFFFLLLPLRSLFRPALYWKLSKGGPADNYAGRPTTRGNDACRAVLQPLSSSSYVMLKPCLVLFLSLTIILLLPTYIINN